MAPAATKQRISMQSVVVVGKNQVSSDLPGEAVILHLPTGRSFALAHVGARIWHLLQEPTCLTDIRNTIVQEYDVQVERCETDVLSLVQELAAEGLVDVAGEQEPTSENAS